MNRLLLGDSLVELGKLKANSVDAAVTDPPYGLSFMGKKWDYDVPSKELWAEVLRVLKPGGHLLSFGGTRTYHRMVVAIEDAGFEIRDQVQWLYGSGFPKSHNLDGEHKGWGTALKPANEPICLARKPLEKGLTVAENVEKWGTGAINIDASRISISTDDPNHRPGLNNQDSDPNSIFGVGNKRRGSLGQGRWPANIILDEQAAFLLDEQSGMLKSGARNKTQRSGFQTQYVGGKAFEFSNVCEASTGGASRFFYIAKASKRERNAGLEGMPGQQVSYMITGSGKPSGSVKGRSAEGEPNRFTATHQNHHPTVKPIKLMEYLCRMITPPGGVILDPFMGSGTTGIAAKNLGFSFIGIELSAEYLAIAEKRIAHV